jgi:hypothetical protein
MFTPQYRGIFQEDEDPEYWREAVKSFPNKVLNALIMIYIWIEGRNLRHININIYILFAAMLLRYCLGSAICFQR